MVVEVKIKSRQNKTKRNRIQLKTVYIEKKKKKKKKKAQTIPRLHQLSKYVQVEEEKGEHQWLCEQNLKQLEGEKGERNVRKIEKLWKKKIKYKQTISLNLVIPNCLIDFLSKAANSSKDNSESLSARGSATSFEIPFSTILIIKNIYYYDFVVYMEKRRESISARKRKKGRKKKHGRKKIRIQLETIKINRRGLFFQRFRKEFVLWEKKRRKIKKGNNGKRKKKEKGNEKGKGHTSSITSKLLICSIMSKSG